jgi:hypothetical protein
MVKYPYMPPETLMFLNTVSGVEDVATERRLMQVNRLTVNRKACKSITQTRFTRSSPSKTIYKYRNILPSLRMVIRTTIEMVFALILEGAQNHRSL